MSQRCEQWRARLDQQDPIAALILARRSMRPPKKDGRSRNERLAISFCFPRAIHIALRPPETMKARHGSSRRYCWQTPPAPKARRGLAGGGRRDPKLFSAGAAHVVLRRPETMKKGMEFKL